MEHSVRDIILAVKTIFQDISNDQNVEVLAAFVKRAGLYGVRIVNALNVHHLLLDGNLSNPHVDEQEVVPIPKPQAISDAQLEVQHKTLRPCLEKLLELLTQGVTGYTRDSHSVAIDSLWYHRESIATECESRGLVCTGRNSLLQRKNLQVKLNY